MANIENLKPFRKGQSGNPKGRPPIGAAIAELARGEIERRGLVEKLGAIAARRGWLASVWQRTARKAVSARRV